MKYCRLLICFSIFIILSFPQANAEDGQDTSAVFKAAGELYGQHRYAESIARYQEFLEEEKANPDPDPGLISISLNNIGTCYYKLNNYKEAIPWYDKALEEDRKTGNSLNISIRYSNLGIAYRKLGIYDRALSYYKMALELDMERLDTQSIAISYNNLGSAYQSLGKYDSAIFYLEKSIELKKTRGDSASIAITLNNIGVIYKTWGKYDAAVAYFEEALKIDRSLGKVEEIPKRLNHIGLAYNGQKKYTKALEIFNEALEMANEQNNQELIGGIYANMGAGYLNLQQDEQAIHYLQLSLNIYEKLLDQASVATVLANLADIYTRQRLYNKAMDNLSRSTKIAESINLRNQEKKNYLAYSEIYTSMGNYSEALNYYKKYVAIKDTLYSEEIHKQITDFEIRYEVEKKDIEINLLKQKDVIQALTIKKQKIFRNSLIGGLALLSLLISVILWSLQQKRRHAKVIANEMAKSDKLLLNILPLEIANDLKETGQTNPRLYKDVTVCFTDMVGFTEQSVKLEPKLLIDELNTIFTAFDNIVEKNNCERIKTIGDSYLAVCGLPGANANHAENIVHSAIEMIQYLEKKNIESQIEWRMRIGIHSGNVIAGVVGIKKYIYDVFGDTINTASRLESASEPMKINVSEATYTLVKDKFRFEPRGEVEVKGKGRIRMYFIKT